MTEVIKKKRGRPKKVKLPEEIKTLVDETTKLSNLPLEEKIEEIKEEKKKGDWDIAIDDEIQFFDKDLSYELTGYRPINQYKGLDFNPDWFTETRDTFIRTGKYCSYLSGSKASRDFWIE